MILYGIPNCDTIKKAKKWLESREIEYEFHDFKKKGITASRLSKWCRILGWETLLNKRGTTWRNLPPEAKDNLSIEKAINQMLEHPALIKRPILETGDNVLCGFDSVQWESLI